MKLYGQLGTDWRVEARDEFILAENICLKSAWEKKQGNITQFPSGSTIELKSGDLLTVFNSINEGALLLNINVNFQTREDELNQKPEGYDHKRWAGLFRREHSAIITKPNGKVIHGGLNSFHENYMEGRAELILKDFAMAGYDSQHVIEDGDNLKVYSCVTDGQILWRGKLNILEKPYQTGEVSSAPSPFKKDGNVFANGEFETTFLQPPQDLVQSYARWGFPAMLERN